MRHCVRALQPVRPAGGGCLQELVAEVTILLIIGDAILCTPNGPALGLVPGLELVGARDRVQPPRLRPRRALDPLLLGLNHLHLG